MTTGLKKTLYFAIDQAQELNKSLAKSVVLENVSLQPIKIDNNKTYNVVNVKLLPNEEGVLELEFDQLEELLMENAKEYTKDLLKKYSGAIVLEEKDVTVLNEKFESDREERLTAHLGGEQKMVRADLMAFRKRINLKGTEASYVSGIFEDIIALKSIDEETPLGNQKKSLKSVFQDRTYLTELVLHEVEALQRKVVASRTQGELADIDADTLAAMEFKGIWPDWKQLATDEKEAKVKAEELAQSLKRGRGRPKKTQF